MKTPWPNMLHFLWFGYNVALELGIFVAGLHVKGDGSVLAYGWISHHTIGVRDRDETAVWK